MYGLVTKINDHLGHFGGGKYSTHGALLNWIHLKRSTIEKKYHNPANITQGQSTLRSLFWFDRHRLSQSMLLRHMIITLLPARVYRASSPPIPSGVWVLESEHKCRGLYRFQWFQYSTISSFETIAWPVCAMWCKISCGSNTGHRSVVLCPLGLDLSLMGIVTK